MEAVDPKGNNYVNVLFHQIVGSIAIMNLGNNSTERLFLLM